MYTATDHITIAEPTNHADGVDVVAGPAEVGLGALHHVLGVEFTAAGLLAVLAAQPRLGRQAGRVELGSLGRAACRDR